MATVFFNSFKMERHKLGAGWIRRESAVRGSNAFPLSGVGELRKVEMADEQRGVLHGALADFRRLRNRAF